MTEAQNLQSGKDFMAWWDNEGSLSMTKLEMHLYDQEEFLFMRCKEAWLNGAYKAVENKMTEEVKDNLIQEIAQLSTNNVDTKTLMQMYYDDQIGYLSSLTNKELAEHIEETQEVDKEMMKLIKALKLKDSK